MCIIPPPSLFSTLHFLQIQPPHGNQVFWCNISRMNSLMSRSSLSCGSTGMILQVRSLYIPGSRNAVIDGGMQDLVLFLSLLLKMKIVRLLYFLWLKSTDSPSPSSDACTHGYCSVRSFALCAVSALFKYIQTRLHTTYSPKSLQIKWKTMEG